MQPEESAVSPPRRLPTPPRGFDARRGAGLSVLAVVAVLALMVAVRVVVGPPTGAGRAPAVAGAPVQVVAKTTSVPGAEAAAVGLPKQVAVPVATGATTVLEADGKPAVTYVGGDYCPFCAAERWALVVALSRFGTFSGLEETRSSPTDVYPLTASFSFATTRFSSRYVTFLPAELYTNKAAPGGGYTPLETMTPLEAKAFATFDTRPYTATPGAFPFVDVADQAVVVGASFTPALLHGLTQTQIAADLSDPASPVTKAVVGTANYLTAAVCAATGAKPGAVCHAPYVRHALSRMKLR